MPLNEDDYDDNEILFSLIAFVYTAEITEFGEFDCLQLSLPGMIFSQDRHCRLNVDVKVP